MVDLHWGEMLAHMANASTAGGNPAPAVPTRNYLGAILSALVLLAVILLAAGVFDTKNPPPSPAFQMGYDLGHSSGGSPDDCASAVQFAGVTTATEQTDWIGGCRAGVQDAQP